LVELRNNLGVGAYGPRIKALIFGLKKQLFEDSKKKLSTPLFSSLQNGKTLSRRFRCPETVSLCSSPSNNKEKSKELKAFGATSQQRIELSI